MTSEEKKKALALAKDNINKTYGKRTVSNFSEIDVLPVETFSSGSLGLDLALGVGGYARGRIVELMGWESSGKCFVADTYIFTEDGLMTVEEIFKANGHNMDISNKEIECTSGLRLLNRYNEFEEVVSFTFNGRRKIRKITLDDGTNIRVTHNHPLLVLRGVYPTWIKAQSIEPGDYIMKLNHPKVSSKDLISEKEATMLGILVADGYFGELRVSITNNDPEIIDYIENGFEEMIGVGYKKYPSATNSFDYHFNSKEKVNEFYRKYGLKRGIAKDKHVPLCVRKSSLKVINAFLWGYLKCESYHSNNNADVTSASRKLIDEVQLLMSTMGLHSTCYRTIAKKYPDNEYWSLNYSSKQKTIEISDSYSAIPGIQKEIQFLYSCVEDKSRDSLEVFWDYMRTSKNHSLTKDAFNKMRPYFAEIKDDQALNLIRAIEDLFKNKICEVKKVESQDKEPTFDFCMKETHSFIANGIVSHNTTSALHAIQDCQKKGGIASFIDAEHAFDPSYAESLGIDNGALEMHWPDSGDQGLEVAEQLIRSGAIDLMVIDSVAALIPKAELEGEMGDTKMGLHARLMGQAMRKLASIVKKTNTCLIFINQFREKIGAMGNPITTSGGNALKFYASQRVEFWKQAPKPNQKDDGIANSNFVRAKVIKNKLAPPFREHTFTIQYGEGIDDVKDLIEISSQLDIIQKSGSWYAYEGNKIAQGMNSAKQFMIDNPELMAEIYSKIKEKISL